MEGSLRLIKSRLQIDTPYENCSSHVKYIISTMLQDHQCGQRGWVDPSEWLGAAMMLKGASPHRQDWWPVCTSPFGNVKLLPFRQCARCVLQWLSPLYRSTAICQGAGNWSFLSNALLLGHLSGLSPGLWSLSVIFSSPPTQQMTLLRQRILYCVHPNDPHMGIFNPSSLLIPN